MKIKIIVVFLFLSILTFGQSPKKFTYQSIIKNSSGYLLKNQEVGLRISILLNSSNGAEVYSEEHFPTSNSNGLVTVIIGEGLTGDSISNIDWRNGEYFLKVEVDPEGGINYSMNQTSQLLSVPYALYAENSGSKLNLLGQDFITLVNQTLTVNKVDLTDDIDGVLPIGNGGTGSDTAPMVGVITAADEAAARSVLGLGTAATTASTDYATAAQGALADTALQDATAFATAAQGIKADGALQSTNNLSDITNVVAARTALGVDASGTDNSTNVSLAGSLDYLTLSGQAITLGQVDYDTDISNKPTLLQLGTTSSTALAGDTTTITTTQANAITANSAKVSDSGTPALKSDGSDPSLNTGITAAEIRSLIGVDASGTDNSTNVSLANTNYLSISGQEITGGTIPISSGGTGATTAAAARTALGVDASGTDNSTNVSLAGSLDYLTLSGQAITLGSITNDDLAGSIADIKLNQITSSNKIQASAIDIDGATDIGTAINDSDLIIIDDGAGGINRKSTVSRLKTYIQGSTSLNSLTDVLVEDESYYIGNEPSNTNTAEKNIAIGSTALDAITTGDYNVAIGSDALTNNNSGNNNIAIGRFTMEDNTSGYQNTAFGNVALQSSTSSGNNVAIGHSSLNNVTDGEKNIGISSSAPSLTTGDKNIAIGYLADVSSNNAQNQIVIGEQASGQGDNYAVIGNEDITRLYAAEDAGAVLFAGGINLSGGTSISTFKFGTLTMGTNASESFTVSGVNASSIVTASFKSGDNGRYIKTVTPSSNTITITLDGAANGGVIMYIIIN